MRCVKWLWRWRQVGAWLCILHIKLQLSSVLHELIPLLLQCRRWYRRRLSRLLSIAQRVEPGAWARRSGPRIHGRAPADARLAGTGSSNGACLVRPRLARLSRILAAKRGCLFAAAASDPLPDQCKHLAYLLRVSPSPAAPMSALQPVRGSITMELRLREEVALWWNEQCYAFYDVRAPF